MAGMLEVVKHSTFRWLRLGCLTLVLSCGDDGVETSTDVDDLDEGDGDASSGDGDAPSGDGDRSSGDGDGDGSPGDGDASSSDGDGDGSSGDGDDSAPGPSEEFLRGRALADMHKCVDCHQEDYAGLGFFPNLTPDETGLANWTDEEIGKAITEGIANDGDALCNGMPKFDLSEQELADLITFLRGLPGVRKNITAACPGHGK
jgi:mono/diheme cytochrome c family protein